MPIEFIARYREVASLLIEAIDRDDERAIRACDRELATAFEGMLAVHPSNLEEADELVTFLLELMVSEASRTPFESQVCDKVRSLVSQLANV